MDLVLFGAAIIAASPPLVFAVLGETIAERAGVINLSLDGLILLTAMAAFAVDLAQIWRTDAMQAMRSGAAAIGVIRRLTLRDVLLGVQIAVCALLVTAALVLGVK